MDRNKEIQKQLKIIVDHFDTGNFLLAITRCKKTIKNYPEYSILYNVLGSCLVQIGSLTEAKNNFIKAIKMDPKFIAAMNNLANTYKNLFEYKKAEELFIKILKIKPNYINGLVNFGNLKRDMNNFLGALEEYKKANEINNKLAIINFSLALSYQGLGEFKLAIEYSNKTLDIDPKFTKADKIISQSKKYIAGDDHIIEMEKKVKNNTLSVIQKSNLHFALGKAYEDTENIKKSIENLQIGNELKRKSINYNFDNEVILFEKIKKIFNQVELNNNEENFITNKNVIFILGMPRSGTTLVEQIITSHSNVYSAGELPYLSKVISEELFEENQISVIKSVSKLNNEGKVLAQKYLDYIDQIDTNKNFITDKAPLNFRWIGFINKILPNSKIIHCSRDPKDNCLSLYKNLFEAGLNFSYDQKELANYYALYNDLLNFWHDKIPNFIHNIKYENLINNQELESKKLIKFCDLNWDDNCLSFHKNTAPIKTMSTAQARQPIYKSSVNSYEKYSPYLGTLNNILEKI